MDWNVWGMPLFTLLVVGVTLGGMYALLRWAFGDWPKRRP